MSTTTDDANDGGRHHEPADATTLVELPEPYATIQRDARAAARRIEPMAVEADNQSTIHPGVREVLRSSGLFRLVVPAEYGGRDAHVDPLALTVAREALMAVSSHADAMFALQGLGSYPITAGGSDEQRAAWLPKVAAGDALPALAVTEDGAGSDVRAITTSVTASADGSFVLSGAKSFISNAGAADFYCVLAREGDGMSVFLVPADAAGLVAVPGPELAAAHVIGAVTFDDVRLPAESRLGTAGEGLKLVLETLSVFRVSVAGAAIGLAQHALEHATRHARSREQFRRPLLRHGPVAGLLADSWAEVAAARLLAYQAARLARDDALANLEHSSMAKLFATETASRVADRCVQVMGRWGLVADSPVERALRHARPLRVYEGASEVLRLGIAQQLGRSVP